MTSASAKDLAALVSAALRDIVTGEPLVGDARVDMTASDLRPIAALLTRYAEVEGELETTVEERHRLARDADHMARLGHEYAGWPAEMFQRLHRDLARLIAQVAALRADRDAANARAERLVGALRLHKAWADSEHAGPDYGGQSRDTHPDGERIWRAWWNNQLDLCERANAATDTALLTEPEAKGNSR